MLFEVCDFSLFPFLFLRFSTNEFDVQLYANGFRRPDAFSFKAHIAWRAMFDECKQPDEDQLVAFVAALRSKYRVLPAAYRVARAICGKPIVVAAAAAVASAQ